MGPRTFLYKLTSDRGGAPCAPPPSEGKDPLLTLSICKPAIRRTAQAGDRVIGLTSQALAASDGYPLHSVLYAAVVEDAVDAREYYARLSVFRHRPDCIYRFHQMNGMIEHSGRTPLHADEAYRARDIGQYPFYKNGRALISHNFRYFGAEAVRISARHSLLRQVVETLGQGHRVFTEADPVSREIEALLKQIWAMPTRFTPRVVTSEAAGHTPRAPGRGLRIARSATSQRSPPHQRS